MGAQVQGRSQVYLLPEHFSIIVSYGDATGVTGASD